MTLVKTMYRGGILVSDISLSWNSVEASKGPLSEAIERGFEALKNGTAERSADLEPISGPQVFDLIDVDSGKHIWVWRVECRYRSQNGQPDA